MNSLPPSLSRLIESTEETELRCNATAQTVVGRWVESRFGHSSQNDPHERALRLIEEASELAQAVGLTKEEITHCVSHVFNRPAGDPAQELAGIGVTSLAMAECLGVDFEVVTDQEIDRIVNLPIDHFRARHQLKIDAGIAKPMELECNGSN